MEATAKMFLGRMEEFDQMSNRDRAQAMQNLARQVFLFNN